MSEHTLPVLGRVEISQTDIGVIALGLFTIVYYLLTFSLGTFHLIVSVLGVLVSIALIGVYIDQARWKAQNPSSTSTATPTEQ